MLPFSRALGRHLPHFCLCLPFCCRRHRRLRMPCSVRYHTTTRLVCRFAAGKRRGAVLVRMTSLHYAVLWSLLRRKWRIALREISIGHYGSARGSYYGPSSLRLLLYARLQLRLVLRTTQRQQFLHRLKRRGSWRRWSPALKLCRVWRYGVVSPRSTRALSLPSAASPLSRTRFRTFRGDGFSYAWNAGSSLPAPLCTTSAGELFYKQRVFCGWRFDGL